MVLCHPNHAPYVLTLISATNWTSGSDGDRRDYLSAPTEHQLRRVRLFLLLEQSPDELFLRVTLDRHQWTRIFYVQPSGAITYDMRTVKAPSRFLGLRFKGAIAYNVYKTQVSFLVYCLLVFSMDFIGTRKDVNFIDSNIAADFTQTPPISKNPFVGSGIDHVTVTTPELTPPSQPFPLVDRQQSLQLPSRSCRFRVCQQSRLVVLALRSAIPSTLASSLYNVGDQRAAGLSPHGLFNPGDTSPPGSVPQSIQSNFNLVERGTGAQISASLGRVRLL